MDCMAHGYETSRLELQIIDFILLLCVMIDFYSEK